MHSLKRKKNNILWEDAGSEQFRIPRKNHQYLALLLIFSLFLFTACSQTNDNSKNDGPDYKITRRQDGSLSGICQVDSMNLFHGLSKAYYADGKTLHSTLHYKHGNKHGVCTKYYMNGQTSMYTNYIEGKKHGQSRRYYKNGALMSLTEYENDMALPGLKEYKEDGAMVTEYPKITFREIDYLKSNHRIDLEIACTLKSDKVNYYLLENEPDLSNRVFLISEKGSLLRHYYVNPGEFLDTFLYLLVEIPTDLGNVMVQTHAYNLKVSN